MTDLIIPSTPADIQKIQQAVIEASNSKLRIQSERDHIKSIYEDLADKVDIRKKDFNKMVNTYFKQNFHEVAVESEQFVELYEKVMAKQDPTIQGGE